MEMNIFKSISNRISKFNVNDFIKELTERLNKMERELVIDRFEGEFAVCEDRKTKEIMNINKSELPIDAKEGMILKYENGKYVQDVESQKEVSDRIKNKMDNLWQ